MQNRIRIAKLDEKLCKNKEYAEKICVKIINEKDKPVSGQVNKIQNKTIKHEKEYGK